MPQLLWIHVRERRTYQTTERFSAPRSVRRAQEPLVVLTAELAPYLLEWREEHYRLHPAKVKLVTEPYGEGSPYHYSAERVLCEQASLTPHRLRQILETRTLTTGLGIADDLLNVVGRSWVIGWELRVYANPNWAPARVERELRARGVETEDCFWSYLDPRFERMVSA